VSGRRLRVYRKRDFPVDEIRRFLEPGPIVLVSSAWKGETNIMTMGWHLLMGFSPSLVGCYIWDANHSHEMIRRSKECVINIPTVDIAEIVIGIGNSNGDKVDKFAEFGLTAVAGKKVSAPLIGECYASFECKLVDASKIRSHNLFIFEVVKGHAAKAPKYPKTIHYRGEGVFMISGENTTRYKRLFKPEML
jgi:flavin reductase (DIM6/NTAB) family NADH-FMN oxidoreductase RutF